MPLLDLNGLETLTINADWLVKSGWIEKVNKQRNIGLGENLGDRALAELADDSYTLNLSIDWVKRERLIAAQTVKFELPSHMLDDMVNQAAKKGANAVDSIKETLALAIESQSEDVKYMAFLKAYLVKWSHAEPINEANLARIPVGLHRMLMYIIYDIHNGQFLTSDHPLEDT